VADHGKLKYRTAKLRFDPANPAWVEIASASMQNGYREALDDGKQKTLQAGFDEGESSAVCMPLINLLSGWPGCVPCCRQAELS